MTMPQPGAQQGQPFLPFTSDLQAVNYLAGWLNLEEPELGLKVIKEAMAEWWERTMEAHKIQMQATGFDPHPGRLRLMETYAARTDGMWAEQKLRNILDYMHDVVDAVKLGLLLPDFAMRDAAQLTEGEQA